MKKVNHIILVLVVLPYLAISQVSTRLSTKDACQDDNIVVSIDVKNYTNVGAISLAFKFDTAVLEYKGFVNLNKGLSSMSVNAKNNGFFMGWAEITPANVVDGKLIDVQFKYKGGECTLYWDTINNRGGNCQIVDNNGKLLKNSLSNTSIKSLSKVSFTNHPQNSTNCYHASDSMTVNLLGDVTNYQWRRNRIDLTGDTTQKLLFKSLEFKNQGYYQVLVKDIDGCGVLSKNGLLKVLQALDTTLTFLGGTLSSNAKGLSYQWLQNNTIMPNETSNSISPTTDNDYAVILKNGICTDTSAVFTLLTTSDQANSISNNKTVLTPNPSNGNFNITHLGQFPAEVEIHDVVGNILFSSTCTTVDTNVNLSKVHNGVYLVTIKTPTSTVIKKLIINN